MVEVNLMIKTRQDLEQDIEKFRFELAEELGIIEAADSGKKSRAGIISYKRPQHKHLSRGEAKRP